MIIDLKEVLVKPTKRIQNLMLGNESVRVQKKTASQVLSESSRINAACIDLVPWGRLHMRPIQIFVLSQWRPHSQNLKKLIEIHQSPGPTPDMVENQSQYIQGHEPEVRERTGVFL